jgi:hypothetical protein
VIIRVRGRGAPFEKMRGRGRGLRPLTRPSPAPRPLTLIISNFSLTLIIVGVRGEVYAIISGVGVKNERLETGARTSEVTAEGEKL